MPTPETSSALQDTLSSSQAPATHLSIGHLHKHLNDNQAKKPVRKKELTRQLQEINRLPRSRSKSTQVLPFGLGLGGSRAPPERISPPTEHGQCERANVRGRARRVYLARRVVHHRTTFSYSEPNRKDKVFPTSSIIWDLPSTQHIRREL